MRIPPLKGAANLKPSPCIPVTFFFRFRFLVSTPRAVVSGSEEVPVQSRNFKAITIKIVFLTMVKGKLKFFSPMPAIRLI